MTTRPENLPDDFAGAYAMILAQRETLAQEQLLRIVAQSGAKVRALEIERLKLMPAKARREMFGQSVNRRDAVTPTEPVVSGVYGADRRLDPSPIYTYALTCQQNARACVYELRAPPPPFMFVHRKL